MTSRPSRRIRFAAVAATAALALSACGAGSTVATVDGVDIDRSAVVSMRTVYNDAATAAGDVFRDDLSGLIIETAMLEAAREQFDIEISDADVAERIANPPLRYSQMFEQMAADESIGEGMVRANSIRSLVRDEVLGFLVLDGYGSADRLLAEAPQDVIQVCARHIMVETEEEALAILSELDGGADFAELVETRSLDTGSPGGVLAGPEGCPLHLSPLGADFARVAASTEVGEYAGPIATEFGFHVITVDERLAPTAAELEADFAAYYDPNAGGSFFSEWFNQVVAEADIQVASSIGTWSSEAIGIVAPTAPVTPGGAPVPEPGLDELPMLPGTPPASDAPGD